MPQAFEASLLRQVKMDNEEVTLLKACESKETWQMLNFWWYVFRHWFRLSIIRFYYNKPVRQFQNAHIKATQNSIYLKKSHPHLMAQSSEAHG